MTIHTLYTVAECERKIAHHTFEATRDGKPARWRELHELSVATWQQHLERAQVLS